MSQLRRVSYGGGGGRMLEVSSVWGGEGGEQESSRELRSPAGRERAREQLTAGRDQEL